MWEGMTAHIHTPTTFFEPLHSHPPNKWYIPPRLLKKVLPTSSLSPTRAVTEEDVV